ncbi:MAG: threonine ammonia-lyase [Thermoproteota archaeon]|nr:threonine ammonia-lyase [Thermoproteota archaeon]
MIPSVEDVKDARKVLQAYNINKTPLQKSNTFSNIIGSNLYLKNESLQTTGTFKIRGALYKIDKLVKEHRVMNRELNMSNYINPVRQNGRVNKSSGGNIIGIIAASAGNHAQGVALASKINNLPCTIVMPTKAPPSKIAATKSYGAKVILEGTDYDDALQLSRKIAKDEDLYQIHAYDDYDVIAGQGTIGLEILEDLPQVDEVYVPIGGGGLASGIAIAIKSMKPEVKIIGVESEAYPAMKESLEKGSICSIKSGNTIADSISIKSPGHLTFEILKKHLDGLVLVDDSSIIRAMFLLMEREKMVIEPSGAAALAYLLKTSEKNGKTDQTQYENNTKKNVVALLSGGNIDMYLLGQVVSKGLKQAGRLFKVFVKLPDKPGAFKSVLDSIVDLGINIVEVSHDRLSPNVPPGMAGVSLSLEMENDTYAERLVSLLRERGIDFTV